MNQALISQSGVLAYEIQKMIKQSVDAAFTQGPWKRPNQNFPDSSAKDTYDNSQKRPMKSAGPYQETVPTRLRRDVPPEMFEADKHTPAR